MKKKISEKTLIGGAIAAGIVLAAAYHFWPSGTATPAQSQAAATSLHPISDDTAFNAAKKSYEITPFNRPQLSFIIDVPQDWTVQDLASASDTGLTGKVMTDIMTFKSPMIGTQSAMITIRTIYPEHEISAGNWLKNHMIGSGYTPSDTVIEDGIHTAKASFIFARDGITQYAYAQVQINGPALVMAQFSSPLSLKDHIAYLRDKTIDSFQLVNRKDEPIEKYSMMTLADALKFDYPASWTVGGSDLRDMNRLLVRLTNKSSSGLLEGLVQVQAIRRNRSLTLAEEMHKLKKYFNDDMKLSFEKFLFSKKPATRGRFAFSIHEAYDIRSTASENSATQEMHLVVLGDAEWYVTAFLITPKEVDNLYTWARNTRSFDEIIESIR